jgi:DNA-directed RNA polymerase specialized sigma24 family protein
MAADRATINALEALYRAGLPRFVRAAAAIVGDEAGGKDAVQEAFAQASTRLLQWSSTGTTFSPAHANGASIGAGGSRA